MTRVHGESAGVNRFLGTVLVHAFIKLKKMAKTQCFQHCKTYARLCLLSQVVFL
uniref:Uncharacterized protein n=1 Tax=Anguilla anguilla TaxID=7936 RepID=A0A0E9WFE4_ANGAN